MQIGVAVDIPEPWGSELTRRRWDAGDPAAGHIPAHLTLLGPTSVDPITLPDIEDHLAQVAAAHRPFPLYLRGTGTFRPVTQVVFVAVAAGISECERLAAAVGSADVLWREPRFPYHPHVTVAHDVPPEALDAIFADLAGYEAQFTVDRITLFEQDHPESTVDSADTAMAADVVAGTPAAAGAWGAAGGGWQVRREYLLGDGLAPKGREP